MLRMLKRLFSLEFLLTPFYIYKFIKLLTSRYSPDTFVLRILRTVLTLIASPIVMTAIILTVIYHHLVELTLRLRHGNNFYSMLDGCDRIWTIKFASKPIVNISYIISPNGNPNQSEQILETLRNIYTIIEETHPSYASTIKSFLGLQYFHKVNVDIKDRVMYMDDYKNPEEFFELLELYSTKPMGHDDGNLWEIRVGRKLIQWQGSVEGYPVFLRHHHALADGVSLVTLTTTHLMENGLELMKSKCMTYKGILEKVTKKKETPIRKLKNFVRKEFSFPTLVTPEQRNILHRNALSGMKHMIYSCEKTEDHLIMKVKAIKNYHGVAFNDVMGTAISASLSDYYVKYSQEPPKDILVMNPYFLMSSDFNKLVRIKDGIPITKLGNKFAYGFSRLPINFYIQDINTSTNNNSDGKTLLKRLKLINKENNITKNALDFAFCYWLMNMCASFPMFVGKYLAAIHDATICVTNMPGNTTSNLINGCGIMSDIIAFANNFNNLGVTFTLFTFNDRFRIGLVVDKDLIEDRNEAQLIVDNIFKYINIMYDQLPTSITYLK